MLDWTTKTSLKGLVAVLSMISMPGCQKGLSDEAQLEREISESVELPNGARNLGEYSRYYAYAASGAVDAIYVVQEENYREEVKKACSEAGTKEYPCDQVDFGVADSGESIWVDDIRDLPAQNGGGCSYIHIKYEPNSRSFLSVECNGPY